MAQTCRAENTEDDGGGTADTCSVISARGSHGSGRYPCSPNEERRAGCRVPSPLLPPRSRVRADLDSRSCIETGSLQRRLGTASAASVPRCAVGPGGKAASTHAAASGVQLTQASSASQCAAVCARVLPPVPADAQNLSVSFKKRERREAWRRVA